MELSDTLTEQLVMCADYIINDWTGKANPDERGEYVPSHRNLFTVEGHVDI